MSLFDTFTSWDRSLDPVSPELEALTGASTPEEFANVTLDWLVRLTRAEAGQAYMPARQDGQWRLAAAVSDPGVTERPPLTLERLEIAPEPAVVERGPDRWLLAPCGPTLLLRVRLKRSLTLPGDLMPRVTGLVHLAATLLRLAHQVTQASVEVERLKAGLSAARVAGEAALRPHRALELLFRLPLRLLGTPDGGLMLQGPDDDGPTLAASAGRGAVLTVRMLAGVAPELLQIPGVPDLVTGSALGSLQGMGVQGVVRIPAAPAGGLRQWPLTDAMPGCAYYFLTDVPATSPQQLSVLGALSRQFSQVLSSSRVMAETAGQYLSTLCALVAAKDGQSPHVIGHSDRMARYARMTARELGLPAAQVEAIALGAYLHDVGMAALDLEPTNREGRLSQGEYELLQEHSRIGAELVGPVQSALPIAPMVTHHHERWDGRGYPLQLKGEEIPLGARIIAACDLFEAKTTGRTYRKPLPFTRALADLQAAGGTQLDPSVVAAFTRAWHSVRVQVPAGRPLAPCWEMRQIPASVCGDCPIRTATEALPCWENRMGCNRHGDECATCLVYTEALSRASSDFKR